MAVQISQNQSEQDKKTLKEHGYHWQKKIDSSSPRGFTWLFLDPVGNQCTPEQGLLDIKNGTVPVYVPQYSHMDRPAAIRWAQSVVNRPQTARPVLVLDTETSGLGEYAVVIEVSIVDLGGHVVFDSLVHLDGAEINDAAAKTHGITSEILSHAPMFPDVWHQLQPLLEHGELIIFNSAFDTRLLKQTAERYGLEMPGLVTHCLMKQYAMYHGELATGSKDLFRSKKLSDACEMFRIQEGNHRALADAQAARGVLLEMAKVEI